jgi:AbiU2
MNEIDQYVDELRDAVRVAWLNYEIWWVYTSTDTRPEYLNTMNKYTLFFGTSIHAHFVALLVALYRLYETRDDTYNIPTFITLLRDRSAISDQSVNELYVLYGEAKPLWV